MTLESQEPLVLSRELGVMSAGRLAVDLSSRRGAALALDASEVKIVGGLCLQVLICARQAWQQDGHDFTITAMSDAFRSDLALLGGTMHLGLDEREDTAC